MRVSAPARLPDMLAQGMPVAALWPCCATAADLAVMLLWALLVMCGQSYFESSVAESFALATADTLQGVCISKGADCQVALEVKTLQRLKQRGECSWIKLGSWLDKRQRVLS